jgi:hypothetical protein
MRDPRNELQSVIQQGKILLQDAERLAADAKTADPKVRLGVGALDALFDLPGAKRYATAAGKVLVHGGLGQRRSALISQSDQWYRQAIEHLRLVSLGRSNLSNAGNSSTLTRRLATAKKFKRMDTQIAHAIGVLETIAEEPLVYNTEIPEFLAQRRQERLEERRRVREARLLDLSSVSPGIELVRLEKREQLRAQFAGHPEVARMIEGALDSYSFSGADANRQALASCRSALELLVKEITREDEWRAGLRKLAEGARKKLVGDAYGFLSGYGSHAGGRPTKHDVALGIRMTIAACLWLIEQARQTF